MLFASLAAAFIAASANIINDYFDIEIDKINRPDRILASGKMTERTAFILYFCFILGGIILSIFVNVLALLIVLCSAILTFYYSYKFKKIPLLGNVIVAFMTGLAFLFGGVSVGNIGAAVFPFIFAFTINLMREIVKDMEDAEGDVRANVFTFPVKFGFEKAKTLLYVLALFLVIAMLIPFLLKIYNAKYLALITFAVVPMLIYGMQILHKKNDTASFGKVSLLLKLQMVFGLLAIFLGS
ncbi:MAG: geranylgeranylglycerol-phosphate geranylgeranyltransferase [Ignavibacteriaceae bacterium]|nr:geranylgeranylglycerol-phosphate geranylgeranyltransferase [Ignavibacteriaceae bacterium]